MYVSGPNRVCALDARTGREIWCYTRTRGSAGAIPGDAAKGRQSRCGATGRPNLLRHRQCAPDLPAMRLTGALMWDVDVTVPGAPGPVWFDGRAAGGRRSRNHRRVGRRCSAPRLHRGIQGVDGPAGLAFLDAAEARRAGVGDMERLGARLPEAAATWLTGSYDPETGLLYWPTGNPFPGHRRRSARRRQSLHQLRRGARSEDRKTALAFSIHSARSA